MVLKNRYKAFSTIVDTPDIDLTEVDNLLIVRTCDFDKTTQIHISKGYIYIHQIYTVPRS